MVGRNTKNFLVYNEPVSELRFRADEMVYLGEGVSKYVVVFVIAEEPDGSYHYYIMSLDSDWFAIIASFLTRDEGAITCCRGRPRLTGQLGGRRKDVDEYTRT
jgi:hypothetical protein